MLTHSVHTIEVRRAIENQVTWLWTDRKAVRVECASFVPGVEDAALRGQLQELHGSTVEVQGLGAVADTEGCNTSNDVLVSDALKVREVICGDNLSGLEVVTCS